MAATSTLKKGEQTFATGSKLFDRYAMGLSRVLLVGQDIWSQVSPFIYERVKGSDYIRYAESRSSLKHLLQGLKLACSVFHLNVVCSSVSPDNISQKGFAFSANLGIQMWQNPATPQNSQSRFLFSHLRMEQMNYFLSGPNHQIPFSKSKPSYCTFNLQIWAFLQDTL